MEVDVVLVERVHPLRLAGQGLPHRARFDPQRRDGHKLDRFGLHQGGPDYAVRSTQGLQAVVLAAVLHGNLDVEFKVLVRLQASVQAYMDQFVLHLDPNYAQALRRQVAAQSLGAFDGFRLAVAVHPVNH